MPEIAGNSPLPVKSDVQQVVAGEFRLVGDEREPGLGLGPHQPLDRIGGALALSGSSTTRSMARLAGSIVVSLSCAGIISPSPLKRA
jgi:hypothetical protein